MSKWTLEALIVRVRDEDGQVYELDMTERVCHGCDDEHYVSVYTIDIAEALELEREAVRGEK